MSTFALKHSQVRQARVVIAVLSGVVLGTVAMVSAETGAQTYGQQGPDANPYGNPSSPRPHGDTNGHEGAEHDELGGGEFGHHPPEHCVSPQCYYFGYSPFLGSLISNLNTGESLIIVRTPHGLEIHKQGPRVSVDRGSFDRFDPPPPRQ